MMPISLFTKALSLLWDQQILEGKGINNHITPPKTTTMDSSQLCTCPAVSLPSRGRHYLLITKQKAHFSDWRRVLARL